MIDPHQMCWDSDVEIALNTTRLEGAKFRQGIDQIERGYDPATGKPLTNSGFNRWITECQQEMTTDDQLPERPAAHRPVFHPRPR